MRVVNQMMHSLTEQIREVLSDGNHSNKLGNNGRLRSLVIRFDMVNSDIPLLMSKMTLKMRINLRIHHQEITIIS